MGTSSKESTPIKQVTSTANLLVEYATELYQLDGEAATRRLQRNIPDPLWRPSLGEAVWRYLVENRTAYDMDTVTWDVLYQHYDSYFYQHTTWLNQTRYWFPAGKFDLPAGTPLNLTRQRMLEAFHAGAGDEDTLHLACFVSELDPNDILNAPNLSVRSKSELYTKHYQTPQTVLEEFIHRYPHTSKQFLTHPSYPLHGLPNGEGKQVPSMNASTLQQGWETQELTLEHLEGRSPYYMKSLCYGIGQFGAEKTIQNFLELLDSFEHAHVLLQGIFHRVAPLQDLGTLSAAVGTTIQLSAGNYLPIHQWWQMMIASRNPLSFAEVDFLLTVAGTKHLPPAEVTLLTTWLDDDHELKVEGLDDLPAHLRWGIKSA